MVQGDQQYLALLANSQRQAQELQLLHAARSALAREDDLTNMFHTIVEATVGIFGYSHASAYLIEGDMLICQHDVGYGEATIREIPVSEGVAGKVSRTGEPILLKDVTTSPEFIAAIPDITSEICVPLFDNGTVVGILNIESTKGSRTLDENDLTLLLALSEHIEIAIGRTRLLHELRNSEERYRTLIEYSTDGVVLLNTEGQIRYASPSTKHILGWSANELIGKDIDDFAHPDDVADSSSLYAQLLRTLGGPISGTIRIFHKDLGWRWCEGTAANMLTVPSVQAIVINYRDITERKLREQELEVIARMGKALRTTEQRADMVAMILDQIQDLVEGTAGALLVRNPGSQEITAQSGYGLWISAKVLKALAENPATINALQTGESVVNADPVMFADRTLRGKQDDQLVAVTCIPLRAQQQIVGALWMGSLRPQTQEEISLLTTISDIAANSLLRANIIETLEQLVEKRTREIEKANEELKELDRLKDRFIANVTHEFRTPITNIRLYLDLIHRKQDLDGPYFSILQGEAIRLASLVEDMLQVAHIQDGSTPLSLQSCMVNEMIASLVEGYQARADSHHLILIHQPDPDLPPVQVDQSKLRQVLTNLIGNAVSYTPEGGIITITATAEERGKSGIGITVHNTGPAIPAEDMPHLFERFYRGRRDAEITTPGTGLGLAICKEIVDQHGGHISVESTDEAGTSFQVWLPLRQE